MPDEKTTLQQQIDAIGGQIDQVVYELYGLTGGDQPYCDNAVTSTMTIRAGGGMTRET